MKKCEGMLKSYYVRTIDENNETIDWFVVEENAQDAVNTVLKNYHDKIIGVFNADGVGDFCNLSDRMEVH